MSPSTNKDVTSNQTIRRDLRRRLRRRRKALSRSTQIKHAATVARHVLRSGVTLCYQTYALYFANDGELDPLPLAERLLRMGKSLAFPVIQRAGTLRFHTAKDNAAYSFNRFGIAEPDPITNQAISALSLGVLFMPLVAFDDQGNRLGMGAGFYDKTLSTLHKRPLLVGMAHELQRLPMLSPQPWDIPLDAVVTEAGWQAFTTCGQRFSR